MPMYNLMEYSDNYSKTSSLWQYCKDKPAANNNSNTVDFSENNLTDSFKLNRMLQFWPGPEFELEQILRQILLRNLFCLL